MRSSIRPFVHSSIRCGRSVCDDGWVGVRRFSVDRPVGSPTDRVCFVANELHLAPACLLDANRLLLTRVASSIHKEQAELVAHGELNGMNDTP